MIAFSVPDMSCGHCSATVTAALAAVDPKARVSVDLDAQRVEVESATPPARLLQALAAAGYPAALIPQAARA